MRLLNAANGDVLSLAFSPDGDALGGAIEEHGVYLWNLSSNGIPVHLVADNKLRPSTLSFSPDGRTLGWADGAAWNVYDRDERDHGRKPLNVPGLLISVLRTPDGSRVVSEHTFPASTLIGWSVDENGWNQDWTVSTKETSIRLFAVDPGGRYLAVVRAPHGKTAGRLDLRSAVSGAVQATGPYRYDQVDQLTFSPDGSLIVAIRQMTLVVWSAADLSAPRLLRATKWKSRKPFTSVAFHPTGRYLFASSTDGLVHVYDTASWEPVTRFNWRIGPLWAVAISPDGTLAAAGNDKGEVMVWDVEC